jgi:hypothetical protein
MTGFPTPILYLMPSKKLCLIEGCDMIAQIGDICGFHKKLIVKSDIKRGDACKYCEQGRMIKAGIRNLKQMYRCNLCGKKYSK